MLSNTADTRDTVFCYA